MTRTHNWGLDLDEGPKKSAMSKALHTDELLKITVVGESLAMAKLPVSLAAVAIIGPRNIGWGNLFWLVQDPTDQRAGP